MKNCLALWLFLICAAATPSLYAQDGVFPTVDARSRFLGGTGLAARGLDAVWINPAGLGDLNEGELGGAAGAEQRWGLSELNGANLGAVYGTGFGGFGIQLASFGFSSYRENRFGISYGRRVLDNLTIGAEFAGFAITTEGYASTFDLTFGLGAQLQVIKELAVGVRIFSPLRVERLTDEYLPQVLSLGLQYRPTDQLLMNLEAEQNSEYPVRFRAGLEYLSVEAVSIRLGVVTADSELSFGIGYRVLESLELTGGAAYHEVLGLSPAFGLRYVP